MGIIFLANYRFELNIQVESSDLPPVRCTDILILNKAMDIPQFDDQTKEKVSFALQMVDIKKFTLEYISTKFKKLLN